MITYIKYLLERIQNRKKYRYFLKKWIRINSNNFVIPKNIIDLSRVSIGSYSYGSLELIAYNKKNQNDILKIGNFVSISTDVKFYLDEHHQSKTFTTFPLKSIFYGIQSPDDAVSKGSIIIDDEVWIGANSTIMSGVHIGRGAIVAMGSVVVSDVPPYSIVGGVPSKIIKMRFDLDLIDRLMTIKLIDIPKNVIKNNMEIFYKNIDLEVIQELEEILKQDEIKNGTSKK